MNIIADLHVHSRFARATSKQLTIPTMETYARVKGVTLLGTGDAQHPQWFKELQHHLNDDDGDGIWRTKTDFPFMLQTELSFMYKQDGKGRRIHLLALFPSIEILAQVQEMLLRHGRIDYDGRPIFKLSCAQITELLRDISHDIEVIPAHIWTPWFGMLGSASGFDSLTQCFGDQSKHIHAIETGLSADPPMTWRLKQLDHLNVVSFSDAHSHWPWKLGREATVLNTKMTYASVLKAIRTGTGLTSTLEFFPEEGKYHYDGHRACNVCLHPSESLKLRNICPKCGRPLTVGVLQRVEQLADRAQGQRAPKAKPFQHLIPLSEVIASRLGSSVTAKKVFEIHAKLINEFGDELTILRHTSAERIATVTDAKLAELIIADRNEAIPFKPGYDGVYGHPDFSAFGVPGMKIPAVPKDEQPSEPIDRTMKST